MTDDEETKLERALATIEGPEPGPDFVGHVMSSVAARPASVPAMRTGRAFGPMFLLAIGSVMAVCAESLAAVFGSLPADGLSAALGSSLLTSGSPLMPPALLLIGAGVLWFASAAGGAHHAAVQPALH